MFNFDSQSYGLLAAGLLHPPRLNELGPGQPNEPVRRQLADLTAERLLAPHTAADPDMAQVCVAGLWLYHNFLDESHKISQEVETSTGSFWHGILHRREPDPDNAKYWFRRVGGHPVFEPLRQAAAELCTTPDRATEFLATQAGWDPYRFIDLCEAAREGQARCEELCRRIQLVEWQLLFDHSYRKAARI